MKNGRERERVRITEWNVLKPSKEIVLTCRKEVKDFVIANLKILSPVPKKLDSHCEGNEVLV